MYISRATIKNYRNFRDFSIDLLPVTLILGANNSGKTNLLEALCLVLGQDITVPKKRVLETDDINAEAIRQFKEDVLNSKIELKDIRFPSVEIRLVLTEFDENQEAVVGDWFVNTELSEAELVYSYHLRDGWAGKEEWLKKQRERHTSSIAVDFPIEQYEYEITGGAQSDRADVFLLRLLRLELLDALRDAKKELVASGDFRLLYRVLRQRDAAGFSEIQGSLAELQQQVARNAELSKLKQDIKSYLDKLSLEEEHESNEVAFKFSSPELSELLKKLSLIYGSNPVTVEKNGLGRNNLLYISLILSHLQAPKEGSEKVYFRVIGIEEPEAHLHPHLQNHLAANIAAETSKDTQIILTSHSAHIAAKLPIENTVLLFKESGGKLGTHFLTSGLDKEDEAITYLRKFLDATKSTMFFARRLLLVEGTAEQLLIPKFFEMSKTDDSGKALTLEKVGCNVVNVAGLAFRHFLKLIAAGYFIKCVVYTDKDTEDTETEACGRVKDLVKDYGSKKDLISIEFGTKKTFEKELVAANLVTPGKEKLLAALEKVKPVAWKKATDTSGAIIEEAFYRLVEDCKADFALRLLEQLDLDSTGFVVPEYIKRGFEFVDG